jgi:trehalose 6-phosphate phosphatase
LIVAMTETSDSKHWKQHIEALANLLKREPLGLITDIDGTISPIAPTPEEAVVTDKAREALLALVGRLKLVAAVSGRGAADAYRMVNVPGVVIAGSHGLERHREGRAVLIDEAAPYLEAVRAALEEAEPFLVRFGMTAEPKGITAALHYRNAPNRDTLRDTVYSQLATVAARHDLELLEGRYVLELRPPLEVDKGTAVTALAEEFGLAGLVYMGDDTTDLYAFRAVRTLNEAGRVGGAALGVASDESPPGITSEADFTLQGVPDVESFLQWMWDNVG